MEPKPIYKTKLAHRIENELISTDGIIRKFRLQRGLALAYAAINNESGRLTISRTANGKPPSNQEIKIVKRDFAAAATAVSQPVLKFKELSRETMQQGQRQHHVIRLSIAFGQQGRLF